MNRRDKVPRCGARIPVQVQRSRSVLQHAPVVAEFTPLAGAGVGRGATRQRVAKAGGIERHAGKRLEHLGGTAPLQDAVVVVQQERRRVAAGRENEHRARKGTDRFEPGGRRRLHAEVQAGAQALPARGATHGCVCGQRRHGAAGGGGFGKRFARISGGCAWTWREGSSAAPRTKRRRRRPARRRSAALLASARSFAWQLLLGGTDLPIDAGLVDVFAIAGQRPRPRGDRLVEPAEAEQHVSVMILDDRVGLQLVGRAFQSARRRDRTCRP